MKGDKYIIDDDGIRYCSENLAKMNVFVFFVYAAKMYFKFLVDQIIEMSPQAFWFISSIIAILVFPISHFINSIMAVRNARKEMRQYDKYKI